jgi:2-iminobutanoate/2-iminopropanoate deaminase
MSKQVIATSRAPAAIGPYSQAVRVGEWVFVSGQIPLHPGTGDVAIGGIEEQTRQALDNLRSVLKAAGASLREVVKTTIYLVDLADFTSVNQIYASYFEVDPPARAAVQVAALPRGVLVEVDAIAHLG